MLKGFKKLKKSLKGEKTYLTWTGKRYNPNYCYYCGELIGEDRFSFHKGYHFHKKCVKLWHDNKRRRLPKAKERTMEVNQNAGV